MSYQILLVEDDSNIVKLLTEILHSFLDATVEAVWNNASAYTLAVKIKPDLIITDIYHPGGTGVDLFFQLRSTADTAMIPVLVVSANFTPDIELKLYRGGVEGVIRKPFQIDQLITRINRILKLDNDPDLALFTLGFETRDLDYKEDIDLSIKDSRAALAKDIIAMANSGGGTIVIGVAETPQGYFEPRGLPPERLKAFDPTKVSDALRKYLGAVVSINIKRLDWRSKAFVLIKVPSCEDTLAMAYCDNESANLYQGRIYLRTDAARSAEVRDSLEISQLIDKLVNKRL